MAAGTLTESELVEGPESHRTVRVKLAWVSNSSGAVNGNLSRALYGTLANVVFVPSGTVAPTNLYDVLLKDEHGVDVLSGRGANLSATVAARIRPGVTQHDGTTASVGDVSIAGKLELDVTNAGDTKEGTVFLYVQR